MSRVLAPIALALVMLVACGGQETSQETTSRADAVEPTPAQTEPTATESATETTEATAPTETTATTTEETSMDAYKDKIAEVQTEKGTFVVRFFPEAAPNHVKNFIDLSNEGFYNGTKFHRIVPGFVIQGGDPNTKKADRSVWGTGGSGRNLKAEFNDIHHKRGILSMARSSSPDSASSQFFVCVADAGFLDKQYTVFGEVLSGMDAVDAIVNGKASNQMALEPVAIVKVTVRDATDSEKKK